MIDAQKTQCCSPATALTQGVRGKHGNLDVFLNARISLLESVSKHYIFTNSRKLQLFDAIHMPTVPHARNEQHEYRHEA
jgi:hypothetical protein